MYLETKRLIIREFTKSDVNDVFEYLSDKIVMEYIEPVMTLKNVDKFIKYSGIRNKLIYAIILKNNNKLIGHLIFHEYNKENIYEFGWILNKKYWNNGYATEVSKYIIKYGFSELKLDKIIAETEEKNVKSIKILENIGMKRIGLNEDGLIEYEIINNEKQKTST